MGAIVGSASVADAKREKRCFGSEVGDLERVSVTVDGDSADPQDYDAEGTTYVIDGAGYDDQVSIEARSAAGDHLYTIRAVRR